jgi:PilZ domain
MNPEQRTDESQRKSPALSRPSCPNCSSQFIKRVRRITTYEKVVSLFHVYPFRCQLCGHWFKLFQPGTKYFRVDEDQREHQRMSVNIPVELAQNRNRCEAVVIDLSIGGCTVRTNDPFALASVVKVELRVPNEIVPLSVDAAVVRNTNNGRVGLEFLQVQRDERQRLRHFVKSLLASHSR